MRITTRVLTGVAFALMVGLLYPYVELAWKCRAAQVHSEACVWARSYFALSRWVEPLIITPAAFVVFLVGSWIWQSTKR